LSGGFGSIGGVKRIVKLLLTVRSFSLLTTHFLQACLKVPILFLEAMFTLIENPETLLQSFGVTFHSRDVIAEIFDLFISLAKDGLQAADLGNQRGADLGSEFDIVNSIGRLVPRFAVRRVDLGRRARGLALKFGRTSRTL
jgi:hypothetical protein